MSPRIFAGTRAAILWVSAAVVLIDQLTKVWAHASLRGGGRVTLIPQFLDLIYSRNAGGLFGYFGDWNAPLRSVLLLLLPFGAVGMILWLLLKGRDEDRRTRLGLALILGGAVGNLIDRLVRGEVVDFIDAYLAGGAVADWLIGRFGTAHWPTFNIADSAIVVGAGFLLLSMALPARVPDDGAENAGTPGTPDDVPGGI